MPFGVAALAAAHIHCNYYIACAENHVQDMMTATPDMKLMIKTSKSLLHASDLGRQTVEMLHDGHATVRRQPTCRVLPQEGVSIRPQTEAANDPRQGAASGRGLACCTQRCTASGPWCTSTSLASLLGATETAPNAADVLTAHDTRRHLSLPASPTKQCQEHSGLHSRQGRLQQFMQ